MVVGGKRKLHVLHTNEDWVFPRKVSQKTGIDVGARRFTDLFSVDDTSFFVPSIQEAVTYLSSFSSSVSIFGLRVSWPKTKIQNTSSGA